MKRIFKKLFILIMAALMIIPGNIVFAKDEDTEAKYLQETKPIIENMKKEIAESKKTGNVNMDFTGEMMISNKCASDISKNLFKYESSKDTKDIANIIIKNSNDNAEEMKKINESLKDSDNADAEKEAEYMNDCEENLKDMASKIEQFKPSGSIDKDYLNIMVIHSECSIKMCVTILKYSDNNDIKQAVEKEMKETKSCMDNINKLIQKSTSKK